MKFLLDHDVPDDLSYLLEQLGHDVTLLRTALPGDSSDKAVLQCAHERGCVLLTCSISQRRVPITASLLLFAVEREQAKGLRCFVCWNMPERPVSETMSTSRNRPLFPWTGCAIHLMPCVGFAIHCAFCADFLNSSSTATAVIG